MYAMLIIAGAFLAFAEKTRSTFINIMAGLVTIAAGVDWIAKAPSAWSNIITGSAIVALGLYTLIMVGVDLFKGD